MESTPEQIKLFDLVYDLYENKSDNISTKYKKNYKYWDGELEKPDPSLTDQTRTSTNIIKPIVEYKVTESLKAKFSLSVMPVLNSFEDLSQMKQMQDYADVLNCELNNVLRRNGIDALREGRMRQGLIGGLSGSQVTFDTGDKVEGEIKIEPFDPDSFGWDSTATSISNAGHIYYKIKLNPLKAKLKYGKNPDGTFNLDICKLIDDLAEDGNKDARKTEKGVINGTASGISGQAYAYDITNIKAGKSISLIVMFLLDDSLYTPSEKDDAQTESIKAEQRLKYPNGRMIIFSPNKQKKFVVEDRPAPEAFKNLGNIDLFIPMQTGSFAGKGEVDDLCPIQDRVNGANARIRKLLGGYINTVILPDELKGIVSENSLVSSSVTFIKGIGLLGEKAAPQTVTNGTIEEIERVMAYKESLKQEAYDTARVNRTMLTGERQEGTNSADMVEALQESPLGSIQGIQRNFKSYMISMGEKIITLIQQNYTVQRLIEMGTEYGGASLAKINGDNVDLVNELGVVMKSFKISKDWKYCVEIVSGSEFPRSRAENSMMVDRIVTAVDKIKDLDALEMYLKEIDYHNWRPLMKMLREKQKQAKANPPPFGVKEIITNPEVCKAAATLFEKLEGYPDAQQAMLKMVGLPETPGTLESTPVHLIASKADVKDIAATTPQKVSNDEPVDESGRVIAGHIIDAEKGVNNGL